MADKNLWHSRSHFDTTNTRPSRALNPQTPVSPAGLFCPTLSRFYQTILDFSFSIFLFQKCHFWKALKKKFAAPNRFSSECIFFSPPMKKTVAQKICSLSISISCIKFRCRRRLSVCVRCQSFKYKIIRHRIDWLVNNKKGVWDPPPPGALDWLYLAFHSSPLHNAKI